MNSKMFSVGYIIGEFIEKSMSETLKEILVDQSNIFVYIELSKLVSNLTSNVLLSKESLKSQVGYFNVISGKYFSDALCPEWESITSEMKQLGPETDQEGRIKVNAFINTINHMSQQD